MPSWIESLRMQHEIDMEQYARAHSNRWNQYLHGVFIPLEYGALVLFLSSFLLPRTSPSFLHSLWYALHLTIVLTTWMLEPFTWVASAAALFSLAVAFVVPPTKVGIRFLLFAWILSWTMQIGIGHLWLEGNRPNVMTDSLSWLAMTQSVLMAWKTCRY